MKYLLAPSNSPEQKVFVVTLILIAVASIPQFTFLINDYWFIEDWLSKGPLIWLVTLFVIWLDLAQTRFKIDITRNDIIAVILAFFAVIVFSHIDAVITPTITLIVCWYFISSTVSLTRALIVWLFLFFSLPFYSMLVPMLQAITVFVSENLLKFYGMEVLVQEFYIAIPAGLFYVEQGCSGFAYMANNLLLVFLYSLIARFNLKQFIMSLLIGISLALIVNWIRVVYIIIFAQSNGVDHQFVQSHGTFGWYLYVFTLFPFFYGLMEIERKGLKRISGILRREEPVFHFPACILGLIPILGMFVL